MGVAVRSSIHVPACTDRTHDINCECFAPLDHDPMIRATITWSAYDTTITETVRVFLGQIGATPAYGSTRAPLPADDDSEHRG